MARVLKCADLKKHTYLSYAIKFLFICLSITALSMSLLMEVQPGTASSELTYMTPTEKAYANNFNTMVGGMWGITAYIRLNMTKCSHGITISRYFIQESWLFSC